MSDLGTGVGTRPPFDAFVKAILPNHRMGRDSNVCECGEHFDLRGMFTISEQWADHIFVAAAEFEKRHDEAGRCSQAR